jgi:hypothetical protein
VVYFPPHMVSVNYFENFNVRSINTLTLDKEVKYISNRGIAQSRMAESPQSIGNQLFGNQSHNQGWPNRHNQLGINCLVINSAILYIPNFSARAQRMGRHQLCAKLGWCPRRGVVDFFLKFLGWTCPHLLGPPMEPSTIQNNELEISWCSFFKLKMRTFTICNCFLKCISLGIVLPLSRTTCFNIWSPMYTYSSHNLFAK